MKTIVLTEPERQWFVAIVEASIDDADARIDALTKRMRKHPSGYIRSALLPQLEAERAFREWLREEAFTAASEIKVVVSR